MTENALPEPGEVDPSPSSDPRVSKYSDGFRDLMSAAIPCIPEGWARGALVLYWGETRIHHRFENEEGVAHADISEELSSKSEELYIGMTRQQDAWTKIVIAFFRVGPGVEFEPSVYFLPEAWSLTSLPGIGELLPHRELPFEWWMSLPRPIPLFSGLPLRFAGNVAPEGDGFAAEVEQAVASFLSLTDADRLAASEAVLGNYQELAEGGAVRPLPIANPEDIWNFVTPSGIFLVSGGDMEVYIQVACACEWERERGLQLVYRGGTDLVRVSQPDGYLTSEDAAAAASSGAGKGMTEEQAELMERLSAEAIVCIPTSWTRATLAVEYDGEVMTCRLEDDESSASTAVSKAVRRLIGEMHALAASQGEPWTEASFSFFRDGDAGFDISYRLGAEEEPLPEIIGLGPLRPDPDFPGEWFESRPRRVPFFSGLPLSFMIDIVPEGGGFAFDVHKSVAVFLSLTVSDRLAATVPVYRNYRDFVEYTDVGELPIAGQEDIWKYVTPTAIHVSRGRDRKVYIQVLCECEWEKEHGLQLVFLEGKTLVRVSEQDGHLTEG